MFYSGLAGGSEPRLQCSVTSGFSSAFPKRRRGKAFPPVLCAVSSRLSQAAGILRGARRKGQGVPRAFIFRQAFTKAKDQCSPLVICISGDRERDIFML